jgi:hypothetical protein
MCSKYDVQGAALRVFIGAPRIVAHNTEPKQVQRTEKDDCNHCSSVAGNVDSSCQPQNYESQGKNQREKRGAATYPDEKRIGKSVKEKMLSIR